MKNKKRTRSLKVMLVLLLLFSFFIFGNEHISPRKGMTAFLFSYNEDDEEKYTVKIRAPSSYSEYESSDPVPDVKDWRKMSRKADFIQVTSQGKLSAMEIVTSLIHWVQNLDFKYSSCRIKHPFEVIVNGGGDCNDKSFLLLLSLMFFDMDAVLLYSEKYNHVAVGLSCHDCTGEYIFYKGKKYYFVESTRSYQIGVVPTNFHGFMVDATVIELQQEKNKRLHIK